MKLGNLLQAIKENTQFLLVCVIVVAALAGISAAVERHLLGKRVAVVKRTRYIAYCGMFGAISMVLFFFEFPLPFLAPGFYKLDFSEIPVMIGAFLLGPVSGVIIESVKILLKLVIRGTSTAFVGELANFVVGCSFVIPASIIYHLHKTRMNAVAALAAGTICITIFGSIFNAIYLLPAFATLYGMPLDTIIQMGSEIQPAIRGVWSFAALAVAPLNLVKGVLISVVTMILYKRISGILRRVSQES